MAANVVINVKALTGQATKELDKLKRQFADLSTSEGWKNLVTGVGVGAGLGAFNALTGAIQGLGDALAEGVQSAAEEEAGIARLAASLKANVPAWDGTTDAVEKTIAARRRLAFTDDDLRQSFSTLVAATGNVSQAFDIQQTAMDLARLRNIDLQTASDALIRVEGGQYRVLKSLGIQLKDNATQTEALAAVQKVAGGQAEAYGNTAAAALFRFDDAVKELYEAIGKRLLPVLTPLVNGLTAIVEGQSEFDQSVQQSTYAARYQAAAVGDLANAWKYARIEQQKVSDVPPPQKLGLGELAGADREAADKLVESLGKYSKAWAGVGEAAKAGTDAVKGALANLRAAMETETSKSARLGFLGGMLYGSELAKGLKSKDPDVRTAAAATREAILAEIDRLTDGMYTAGANAAAALAAGVGALIARAEQMNETISPEEIAKLQQQAAAYRQIAAELRASTSGTNPYVAVDTGAASAAEKTAELVKQAKAAIATLSGLKGVVAQLGATMQAGWTPVVQTAAQAQAGLTAAATKFNQALAALKPGVATTLTAVQSAFEKMRTAALAFYEAQRRERVADLTNAIAAAQANVQAFRDQLDGFRRARQQADLEEAARNARGIFSNALDAEIAGLEAANAAKAKSDEEARLKAAVTAARTRKDRKAAQQALDDFYARTHLEELQAQRDRERAIVNADQNLLDFQQDADATRLQQAADAQVALYNQQIEAANQQYDAQVSTLGRIAEAVSSGLDGVKDIWDTKNKEILGLLGTFTAQFQAAGAALAAAFNVGLGSLAPAVAATATATSTAVSGAATTVAKAATTVAKAATTATKAATTAVTTAVKSGGEGGSGTVGKIAYRAAGGPVASGRSYIVGERGPELLTMGVGQSGYVTPNGGGGAPVQINLVVDGRKIAELVDSRLFLKYRTAARTTGAV